LKNKLLPFILAFVNSFFKRKSFFLNTAVKTLIKKALSDLFFSRKDAKVAKKPVNRKAGFKPAFLCGLCAFARNLFFLAKTPRSQRNRSTVKRILNPLYFAPSALFARN